MMAAHSMGVFMAQGTIARTRREPPRTSLPPQADRAASAPWWVPALVALLACAYFIDPNPRLDFSVFDTRDAENYLALSHALVKGIGYTRSLDPQFYVPHTTWPPGLPILLMPAMALSGVPIDLLVIKLGMIAYGAIGIALAYLYARRLSRTPAVQLGVPLLLGLNPHYWQFSRMTDSEMPTVLWALLALLLAEIGWAKGMIRHRTALAFGLVAGFGMLIRFSLFGALLLPLVWLFLRRAEPVAWRRMASRYLAYALGFVVPSLIWVAHNSLIDKAGLGQDGINQLAMFFRTIPVDPHSPLRTLAQTLADMRMNVWDFAIYLVPKSIVPGLWSAEVWHHLGAAAMPVALVSSLAIVALSWRSLRNLPVIVLYGSMAAVNVFYAAGGMTRLWVPVSCLIAVSLPLGAERLALFRRGTAGAWWTTGATAAALAASLAFYIVHHDAHPYRNASFAALAQMFEDVRDHYRLEGNVLTASPQAFGLYTGQSAPMSVPAAGVDPLYAYVILPSAEWNPAKLAGTLVTKNAVWSLVKLDAPLRLAEFRARHDCTHAALPAFAVVSNCMIW
jgi:Dolichyl-phosphate-mannose-protein mannosyltransferase